MSSRPAVVQYHFEGVRVKGEGPYLELSVSCYLGKPPNQAHDLATHDSYKTLLSLYRGGTELILVFYFISVVWRCCCFAGTADDLWIA